MTDTACPHLYLKFGCRPTDDPPIARAKADAHIDAGHTFGLDWCHYYGPYAVQVFYVEDAVPDDPALVDAWHPRLGLPDLKLLLIDKNIDRTLGRVSPFSSSTSPRSGARTRYLVFMGIAAAAAVASAVIAFLT
jgi:hypothetical protein